MKKLTLILSVLFSSISSFATLPEGLCANIASDVKVEKKGNDWILKTDKNFLNGFPATNKDGSVNVVVEIPSGCNDKWEVKKDGSMIWDKKKGKIRFVQYLAYPGNYGMIPSTLSGDNDPLDVIVLGPAAPRGSVIKTRIVAILRAIDKGETDDKLIAVPTNPHRSNPFSGIHKRKALPKGAIDIVETWFKNYKGNKKMKILGVDGAKKANLTLRLASKRFMNKK